MKLILGTAQLARRYGVVATTDAPTPESARAILDEAMRAGIDALDTAPVYGDAEQLIGASDWMREVHTKFDPAVPFADSVRASLARLRRHELDVVYLHDPSVLAQGDDATITEAAAGAAEASARLGVSVYTEDEFDLALARAEITVIQAPISVFDRRFTGDRLKEALDAGKTVHARSVLLQGVLVSDPDRLPSPVARLAPWLTEFRRVAESCGTSPYDLALGWVTAQSGVSGLILGASTVREVSRFAECLRSYRLGPDALAALAEVGTPDVRDVDPRLWAEPR